MKAKDHMQQHKISAWLWVFVVAFIAFARCLLPFSTEIDRNCIAQRLQIENGLPVSSWPVEITIRGTYHKDLLGRTMDGQTDWFQGSIALADDPVTAEWELMDVFFERVKGKNYRCGTVMYREVLRVDPLGNPLYGENDRIYGKLYMSRDGSEFILWLFEKGTLNVSDGTVILSPGLTWDKAKQYLPY